MKIAAFSKKSQWAGRALRDESASTSVVEDFPFEASLQVTSIDLMHHGPDRNFRPFLHIAAHVEELLPREPMAYGIESLSYEPGKEPSFDGFLEFTDEDLAELAMKGAWQPGFQVPQSIIEAAWELPALADLVIVPPRTADEPPVVFVEILDRNSRHYDDSEPEKTSGYENLSDYFPERDPEAVVEDRPEARTRTGEIDDLFAGVQFLEPDAADFEHAGLSPAERAEAEVAAEEREREHRAPKHGFVPRGLFEKTFGEHEQVRPTLVEPEATEPEPQVSFSEELYQGSVQPEVQLRLSERAVSAGEVEAQLAALHGTAVEEPEADSASEQLAEAEAEVTVDDGDLSFEGVKVDYVDDVELDAIMAQLNSLMDEQDEQDEQDEVGDAAELAAMRPEFDPASEDGVESRDEDLIPNAERAERERAGRTQGDLSFE